MHGETAAWQHLQIGLEPPEDGTLRLARVLLLRGHTGLDKLPRLTAWLIEISDLCFAPAATADSQLAFTAATLWAPKHSEQL